MRKRKKDPGTSTATGEPETLVPGNAAIRGSITHAVVIKEGDLFFLSEPDGSVPLSEGHGFGLYYHDCRFLNGYTLRMGGQKAEALVANAERGAMARLGLFNPELRWDSQTLPKHQVEIRWSRAISSKHLALLDTLTLHSLTAEPVSLPITLSFQSGFEDIFAIRGLFQGKRGTLHAPEWREEVLHFLYEGADGINRELEIHFAPDPASTERNSAHFQIELAGKGCRELQVSLFVRESGAAKADGELVQSRVGRPASETLPRNMPIPSCEQRGQVRTDSLLLNRVLDRSLRDLGVLRSDLGQEAYFAAGVPWFVALFGRDSIITAMQTLAYDPGIAEQTIRLLAEHQGTKADPWREEDPGKILHELRVGEMANLREVPHTPYYGTVDATPLWLMLVGQHAAWTGDLRVFRELRGHIEAALNWIERYGDSDADGYVDYECRIDKGLANQGWKDSADGIVNADGSLARAPIALVEVQGYVYRAKLEMAALFHRAGETERADQLENDARQLHKRFNQDFWVKDGYYALALQQGKSQAAVLSSNAGHALWTGIAESERARKTADHLLSREMFNGWGIRTLSAAAVRYNPLGYHLGTVWPHDNSLIGAGFKRYGLDAEALRILSGMIEAAVHFDAHRLPELFGGFAREDYGIPVSYPVACQPQAWAAGAVPYLLTSTLGLEPEAFERRLRVVRPVLAENVNHLEFHQLQVGKARVDLLFERTVHGIDVRVLAAEGDLEILIES